MPPVKKAPETKTSEVVVAKEVTKEPEVVEKKPAAKGRSVKVQPEPIVVPKKEKFEQQRTGRFEFIQTKVFFLPYRAVVYEWELHQQWIGRKFFGSRERTNHTG